MRINSCDKCGKPLTRGGIYMPGREHAPSPSLCSCLPDDATLEFARLMTNAGLGMESISIRAEKALAHMKMHAVPDQDLFPHQKFSLGVRELLEAVVRLTPPSRATKEE